MKRAAALTPFAFALALTTTAWAAEPTLTIDASKPIGKVSPLHYGLMTEEINHSYDGGLYAELIQNRSFLDDGQKPAHWAVVQSGGANASVTLDKAQPRNPQQPVSLRLDVTSASKDHPAGVSNDGYWGIPVKPNTRYNATFYARAAPGFSGPLTLAIQSEDGGTIYATAKVVGLSEKWQRYTATLTTGKVVTTSKARFLLTTERPGTFWLGYVSLFPPTYKNRPNGLRPDLLQMLVDLKPGFLRFPGGNYLEGITPETRFDWKKTLGPPDKRPGNPGTWGYRSTTGMGMMEFLLWCEDMGAEPLLGIYAGYSLGGTDIPPGPALAPYVQDALDEIEYITGSTRTKWGAVRARDGHPKPFPLRYVQLGNEEWNEKITSYDGRFTQFYDAIKAKYPHLKVISSEPPKQWGPRPTNVHSRKLEVLDEHYYNSAEQFLKISPTHYEGYDRATSPEIFVGEWAAHEDFAPWDERSKKLPPTPSMKAALGDAAWMTAMERNADLVTMQCYAPLLANVNPGAYQWRPNMIGYDALHVFGSPSYYAFRMFSRNHGDKIIKGTLTDAPTLQSSVTRDSKSGLIIVKLVNPGASAQAVKIKVQGIASLASSATAITLAADTSATNAIDVRKKVVPVTSKVSNVKPGFIYTLPAYSITVLQLKGR